MSGARLLHLVFVIDTCDCLALVARGACVPGSHRSVTTREMVLGMLPPPENQTDSRLKHLSRNVSLKAAFSFLTI